MRVAAAILAALLLSGCVSAEHMIRDLSKSKRSWCLYWAGTPGISGPVFASGSGVEADADGGAASADCSPQGHKVNMSNTGMGQAGAVVTPSGAVILPAAPRVYQQEAPAMREVPVR